MYKSFKVTYLLLLADMQPKALWRTTSYFCSGEHEYEFEALAKLVQVVTVTMDTIVGPVADRQWDFCPVVDMFHIKALQAEEHKKKFHSMLWSDGCPKINDVIHITKYFTVIYSVESSDVIAARIHNNYSWPSLADYWISFGQVIYAVDAVGSGIDCRNAPVKLSIDSRYPGDGWLRRGDIGSRAWPGSVGRRNNVVAIAPYEWVAHQNHAGEIRICGSHWGCWLYSQLQFVTVDLSLVFLRW